MKKLSLVLAILFSIVLSNSNISVAQSDGTVDIENYAYDRFGNSYSLSDITPSTQ